MSFLRRFIFNLIVCVDSVSRQFYEVFQARLDFNASFPENWKFGRFANENFEPIEIAEDCSITCVIRMLIYQNLQAILFTKFSILNNLLLIVWAALLLHLCYQLRICSCFQGRF